MSIGRHDGGPSVPNSWYDEQRGDVYFEGDPCPICGTPLFCGLQYLECDACGWQDTIKEPHRC